MDDEPQATDPLVLRVREGELDSGSFVYVWVQVGHEPRAVYVGATGLHPIVRTWLHLNDPDPVVGRIRALLPSATSEPFDVLALRLPPWVSRQDAKAAVIARLAERRLLSDDYVGEPPLPLTDAPAECVEYADALIAKMAN